MFAYTVLCTFENPEVADAWADWLRDGHLADVCAAGAIRAELVRLDGSPVRLEARYTFASRGAFEAYERDHAARLRAEGLERFPLSLGLSYERTTGEITAAHPSGATD